MGDGPLSLSVRGLAFLYLFPACDEVSCTRLPRTRHMGESVTLTFPILHQHQPADAPPVPTQGPCHYLGTQPAHLPKADHQGPLLVQL